MTGHLHLLPPVHCCYDNAGRMVLTARLPDPVRARATPNLANRWILRHRGTALQAIRRVRRASHM